jgi:hypothetical protein
MEDESDPLTDDPEIVALLDFEPVPRKCKRRNGWTPANQRGFIAGLAETGDADGAAEAVGLTARGAYDLRKSPDHEPFFAAWDKALALFSRRNPQPPRTRRTRATGGAATAELSQDEEEAEHARLGEALLNMYWVKVKAERRCRLEGRILDADFYVRQLTAIEIACDLSEHGGKLLAELKRGGVGYLDVVATPLSLYFDYLRRSHWAERGEAERPELPRLAEIHDGVATGPTWPNKARADLSYADWRKQQNIAAADAAKAQLLWEEKARKDAAEWRARVEVEGLKAPATELGP